MITGVDDKEAIEMSLPKIDGSEALKVGGEHFVDCIINSKTPQTDGKLGLRVVELIEAATTSMRGEGSGWHRSSKAAMIHTRVLAPGETRVGSAG